MASMEKSGLQAQEEPFFTIIFLIQQNGIFVMIMAAFAGTFLLKVPFKLIAIRLPLAFLTTLTTIAGASLAVLPME